MLAKHPHSFYDAILSNHLAPYSVAHSFELLSEIVNLLKPSGILYGRDKSLQSIQTHLTLAGFCNITLSSEDPTSFLASKPSFEMGSSSKLSFAKPSVWTLSNSLKDEEVELIDQDELLEDSDFLKPAAESLRGKLFVYVCILISVNSSNLFIVCGTTGKRKACKDCSCGLAEELAVENGKQTIEVKATSSCGSVSLGISYLFSS